MSKCHSWVFTTLIVCLGLASAHITKRIRDQYELQKTKTDDQFKVLQSKINH